MGINCAKRLSTTGLHRGGCRGTRNLTPCLARCLCLCLALTAWALYATPPYGDPNQPYDRLPGTLETYHVKWSKPNATGKLNALLIIPYFNSREVVEAAQRLDLKYTVIMNAANTCWDEGYFEGVNATPLKGVEGRTVLNELAENRLSLANHYDVIVVAKVSWELLPPFAKDLLLKHVERGTGLVYLSPSRLKPGLDSREEAGGEDETFTRLLRVNPNPAVADAVLRGLPLDILPLRVFKDRAEAKALPPHPARWNCEWSPLLIGSSSHGKGRILALDYFDAALPSYLSTSLSFSFHNPGGAFDKTVYDYSFAILTRAMLWASGKEGQARASIEFGFPAPKAPLAREAVVYRDDLPKAKLLLRAVNPEGKRMVFDYAIRSRDGKTSLANSAPPSSLTAKAASLDVALPTLSAGTYLVDLRLLDSNGQVMDFASKSFKVESSIKVMSVTTAKDSYRDGETVTGKATFSGPLPQELKPAVKAVDTWGRTVAVVEPTLDPDRRGVSFSFPVNRPLSQLWDVACSINDAKGEAASASAWFAIPKWTYDDYLFMLIFAPTPGRGYWKGWLYAEQMRKYGINSTFTYLIYSMLDQYENNARAHLWSVAYAAHMGESNPPPPDMDFDKEYPKLDLAEVSRMCRHVAKTGEKLDPKEFPFTQMGYLDAKFINARVDDYKKAAKFGTPFYTLTGENTLSGEFLGKENSGFGPTATKLFQEWCRKEYKEDIGALNIEWNSDFKSWDQIRGIMIQEAVEKNQLPRWVDFRYFMRSKVWSQFFIDWTDMMRRFAPETRTGRCGHDHHDFSRYRDAMTCAKLYIGQEVNSEWRHMIVAELQQSFSGDRSFLLAPQSLIRWTYDLETPLARQRWPWMVLFMGLNGFDWERGLSHPTLGGESCFTPDYSEPLPFFKEVSKEVRAIQGGIGKLVITGKPRRSKVAMLWSPRNHYISRLLPFQENGFSGTWLYNMASTGGAPSDCLALLNSIRVRPTIVAPEDLLDGGLERRGFTALFLPYSKGMSPDEVEAVEKFVAGGGLVIADNEPGTYSQHGKPLPKSSLAGLFPDFTRQTVTKHGGGRAAYLPNAINGYVARMERGDYTGADSVASLLKLYAGIVPPVELLDAKGLPRRDVYMPLFDNGSTQMLGLLRCVSSKDKEGEETTVRFDRKYHVWDAIAHSYQGCRDSMDIRLGLFPKLYALLPANPASLALDTATQGVDPGGLAIINGSAKYSADGGCLGVFRRNPADDVAGCVHVTVQGPDGEELEFHTQNIVFQNGSFSIQLPIAYSAVPGRYTVEAVDAITGMRAETRFDVKGGAR